MACTGLFYLSRRYRYVGKRYRRRYIKKFETIDGELTLNEHGEYETKYGDWLHAPHETVYVRDRKIWEEEFRKVRKKYQQEYYEKFRHRLAKFTQIADSKMYELNLQEAQKKERQRLSDIRVNALNAADSASKSRERMEKRRRIDLIRYDSRDQRRDVIRGMLWEKPARNWITKENFNGRLNVQFFEDLLASEVHTEENGSSEYRGLPQCGYYDSMEGVLRHSDRYFDAQFEHFKPMLEGEKSVTTVTRQPISWYRRKNDTKDEYVEEIYASQLKVDKHLKRNTKNNKRKAARLGIANINQALGKQQSIEYEFEESNIVPNYWLNIDFDAAFQQRAEHANNLDKSCIFIGNKVVKLEYDAYEDYKFIFNAQYHALLKKIDTLDARQITDALRGIFAVDDEELAKRINVEELIADIVGQGDTPQLLRKDIEDKQWSLYTEFHAKMKHFHQMRWQSAKINFDSALRQWRRDFLKWRHVVFDSNQEHIEWRQKLRAKEMRRSEIALCQKAIVRLQQLEHLILARRTGPDLLLKLVTELEDDVLKVWYVWFEELTEFGEEIAMGKGWSFNRYYQVEKLPGGKTKQIPIEYFKLPVESVDGQQSVRVDKAY